MDNKETALKRRFAGAWLRCFDADAAAAQVGRTDGVRLLTTNGVQEEIALQRGQCDVCRADVVRRLAQLAFGRANDCVKLVLLDAPDLDALDLSLLAEVKRNDKGTVEIKLIDRLQALEQLATVADGERTDMDDFLKALQGGGEE